MFHDENVICCSPHPPKTTNLEKVPEKNHKFLDIERRKKEGKKKRKEEGGKKEGRKERKEGKKDSKCVVLKM